MLKVYTDGASRGNPGKSAGAFVVYENDEVKHTSYRFYGIQTNNQSEYQAMLDALKYLSDSNMMGNVDFFSDSELMVKQIKGEYKVRDLGLAKIYQQVIDKIRNIDKFSITHIKREKNSYADKLVNKCLDES
jgi:ribonuclease HI